MNITKNTKLHVYGTSYNGRYYFKIRTPSINEKKFTIDKELEVTIDVLILNLPTQARTIIATPMAATNTYLRDDATDISRDTWDKLIVEHCNKLIEDE